MRNPLHPLAALALAVSLCPTISARQTTPPAQKRYCALPSDAGGAVGPGEGVGQPSAERPPVLDPDDTEARAFTAAEVDRRAAVLRRPEPTYTQEALDRKVRGAVTLRAVLCPAGHVAHIEVLDRLPHGLTERAVAAARNIKFKPAVKDGAPVAQVITIRYNFDPEKK